MQLHFVHVLVVSKKEKRKKEKNKRINEKTKKTKKRIKEKIIFCLPDFKRSCKPTASVLLRTSLLIVIFSELLPEVMEMES